MSSPEQAVLEALIEQLKTVMEPVYLGYSATGSEQDLELPALLVQLESMRETRRQGYKARYRMDLLISVPVKTETDALFELLTQSNAVRDLLTSNPTLGSHVREVRVQESRFDIAPHHGQWSFVEIDVQIDLIR